MRVHCMQEPAMRLGEGMALGRNRKADTGAQNRDALLPTEQGPVSLRQMRRADLVELLLSDLDAIESLEDKLAFVTDRLGEETATANWLKERLGEQDETIERLRAQLDDRDATIAALRSQVAERDAQIGILSNARPRPDGSPCDNEVVSGTADALTDAGTRLEPVEDPLERLWKETCDLGRGDQGRHYMHDRKVPRRPVGIPSHGAPRQKLQRNGSDMNLGDESDSSQAGR